MTVVIKSMRYLRWLAIQRGYINLNVALKRQLGMLPNLYQAGLLDVL
jgi:hypothetical protein